uniref:IRF tryptophan pentad repeat domain-containing protein n=1 Tax=Laticauda laticaudata TaxID=8630 RepID=A0A8C5WP10_LATLA
MATSKRGMRSTRKLRDWTVEQVESGKFQGLVWDDPPAKTMFRIPWKHAGKQEFRQEEDAGFFKAWAIYKGKYNPGEYNPATWKTRVRCALSKSPEFEEVPSRSRLDISEPYKVYRLVPVLEQVLGNKVKKQNTKQVKMDDSGSPGAASPQKKSQPPANSLLLLESAETPAPEVMASHLSNCFNLPNCQSREVSPQATEPDDFSFWVSISYAGEPPSKYLLPEGEYLFTSVPESLNGLPNCLKRFVLTAPATMANGLKQEIVQRLLKDLVKGIMVASNHGGIFILCRDKVCVSWSGFLAPEGQNKLVNNTHQQLFKSREFRSALELYQEGLGPLPDPRVILYVGDELDGNEHMGCKSIIIQMEQTFAIRMCSSCCSQ